MSAPGACAEPGIICTIVGFAESLFTNPWLAVAAVVVLLLSLIGLHTVRKHHAEHGLRKTAVRGLGLLRDTGYTLFSTAKFAGVGTGPGIAAACLAFLAGIAHFPSSSHTPHGSDASAVEEARNQGSRALVPVMELGREAVAKMKESAPIRDDGADPLKDAAWFANELPNRKVEVHFGKFTVIVHPEKRPDDVTPA